MASIASTAPKFRHDLFDGAAHYFARYQADYPQALFEFLRSEFGLNSQTRVLDLGCGTGQIGVPLAAHAGSVVCVDPDAGMLEEARRFASSEGASNIQFIQSRSEDLSRKLGPFRLVTLAGAFHWMDRPQVLRYLEGVVEDTGGVCVTMRERSACSPGDWWNELWRYVKDFWGGYFPAGKGGVRPTLDASNAEVLADCAFSDVIEVRHAYEYHWQMERLVGYVFSTSKACPGVLGDRKPEFEAGLRRLFTSLSPSGDFIERGDAVTLAARRPASRATQ